MLNAPISVSFIGLGAMGFGMATHLLQEGYTVTGYDVYRPILDKFEQQGGLTATTAAEAASGKNFCICMVATAQQAQSVLVDREDSVVNALPKGAVLLLCSTVPCAYVQGLEAEFEKRGRNDIVLIDCPVSGGAARAATGSLSIMAGGSNEAVEKGADLLRAMADPAKLYIVNGGIGSGSNTKMCHQVLVANQILAASEAMGFAKRLGLELTTTSTDVIKSDAWSWMFENRLPRMLQPDFCPLASALTIIAKDTSIITSEARRTKFSALMTAVAEQVYFTGLDRGFGPDEDSGLIRLYEYPQTVALSPVML